ncbi:MAG TPA: efflux transporter outer membrane subunit [Steroidobacteraceae bacterium]|nr:efflux transporter outer membrane subunit [Steroidobacteraceae bacterium]
MSSSPLGRRPAMEPLAPRLAHEPGRPGPARARLAACMGFSACAIFTGACAILAGCAVGPDYHTPDIPLPAHLAASSAPAPAMGGKAPGAATAGAPAPNLASWWCALRDPELNSLVQQAITDNPDVQIALDRLQAARTYEAALIGTVLPDAEGSAGAGWGTGTDLTRGRAAQSLIAADDTTGLEHINTIGGFDSVWELDVFGKYRREMQAAHFDTQSLAAARDGVLVGVIADVAQAYIDLRGTQARAAVLEANIAVLRESQRIVHIRFQRGITNELDVTLADRELADLSAQLAPMQAQVNAGKYAIATLLGRFPEQLVGELKPAMVPATPQLSPAALPLDLLRQRPDIREVERELGAATARIGVATGDLFPDLAVTAAVGFQKQGLNTDPAVGQHIWSAGPSVLWPLLDFGTLDAQVDIADLRTRELLIAYRHTIQAAVQDVDTQVESYAAEQSRLQQLGDALVASQRAVELAQQRYDRGLTDFLNVVDAERQAFVIQDEYAVAQTVAADEFVSLYRSLGGGWQSFQKLPDIRRPQPAIIAIFRRLLTRDDPLKSPM